MLTRLMNWIFNRPQSSRDTSNSYANNPAFSIITPGSSEIQSGLIPTYKLTELYDHSSELLQLHAQRDDTSLGSIEDKYTLFIEKITKLYTPMALKSLFNERTEHKHRQKLNVQLLIIAYLNRGHARALQEKDHAAISDFTTLLELDQEQHEARFQRSMLYAKASKYQRELDTDFRILERAANNCNFYWLPIKCSFSLASKRPTNNDFVTSRCNSYILTPQNLFFFNKITHELNSILLTESIRLRLHREFGDEKEISEMSIEQLRLINEITHHDPHYALDHEVLYNNSYVFNGLTLRYISSYGITEVISLSNEDIFLEEMNQLFHNSKVIQKVNLSLDQISVLTNGHCPDAQKIMMSPQIYSLKEVLTRYLKSAPKVKPTLRVKPESYNKHIQPNYAQDEIPLTCYQTQPSTSRLFTDNTTIRLTADNPSTDNLSPRYEFNL